jgi:hypothetical protein
MDYFIRPRGGFWLRAVKVFVVLGGALIASGLLHWLWITITR